LGVRERGNGKNSKTKGFQQQEQQQHSSKKVGSDGNVHVWATEKRLERQRRKIVRDRFEKKTIRGEQRGGAILLGDNR